MRRQLNATLPPSLLLRCLCPAAPTLDCSTLLYHPSAAIPIPSIACICCGCPTPSAPSRPNHPRPARPRSTDHDSALGAMTSRPGPGIQESLQHRGSGVPPRVQIRRRPSKPVNYPHHVQQDCIDPSLEDQQRPATETIAKSRPPAAVKTKLEGIQTSSTDVVRPPPKGKPQVFFTNGPELPLQSPHGHASHAVNLPMPPRPGNSRFGDISQQQRIIPGGTGVKGPAATKAPSTDAPAAAILFPGNSKSEELKAHGSVLIFWTCRNRRPVPMDRQPARRRTVRNTSEGRNQQQVSDP